VIEFLAQMPADTKIFLTMAVLGLAAVLNAQTAAPPSVVQKITLTAIVDETYSFTTRAHPRPSRVLPTLLDRI
jgi:hypothetical protein